MEWEKETKGGTQRERERERETDRQTDRQRQTDRERQRETERERRRGRRRRQETGAVTYVPGQNGGLNASHADQQEQGTDETATEGEVCRLLVLVKTDRHSNSVTRTGHRTLGHGCSQLETIQTGKFETSIVYGWDSDVPSHKQASLKLVPSNLDVPSS